MAISCYCHNIWQRNKIANTPENQFSEHDGSIYSLTQGMLPTLILDSYSYPFDVKGQCTYSLTEWMMRTLMSFRLISASLKMNSNWIFTDHDITFKIFAQNFKTRNQILLYSIGISNGPKDTLKLLWNYLCKPFIGSVKWNNWYYKLGLLLIAER